MQYSTPIEAEQAFYKAFSQQDVSAMMAIWLNTDYIECIHPGSRRLIGPHAIEQSWTDIFKHAEPLNFQVETQQRTQSAQLAIHTVTESITQTLPQQMLIQVYATNVYELTQDGWRMVLHHASPGQSIDLNKQAVRH